jgi:catechol 2,3-dioxygenase
VKRAPVISEIGHAALRVTDLAAAEAFAVHVMGLSVSERSDDSVWLTHGDSHHSLQYMSGEQDVVDHVGLVARDGEALVEIRARIDSARLPVVSDGPLGPGIEDGFAFEGPEGFVIEVYSRMSRAAATYSGLGIRPNRFGHVNFFLRDPAPMQRLLTELLDFRVSDLIQGGVFLRCNVDHHGIGVFEGAGLLHHYAWEVPSIAELAALADLVDARGGAVLWGPVRHGMGHNIALYLQDTTGVIVEYYSDMHRIYDDANYVPGNWERTGHKWYSLWGPGFPDGFAELGLPPHRHGSKP